MLDIGVAPTITQEHLDMAKFRGEWNIHELLNMKKVGENAVRTVEKEKEEVTRRQAIAASLERSINSLYKTKVAKDFIGKLREVVCDSIRSKHPVSDHMLLTVWRNEKERPKVLKSLTKSCREILKIPINKKTFFWFQKYILKSGVFCLSLLPFCLSLLPINLN